MYWKHQVNPFCYVGGRTNDLVNGHVIQWYVKQVNGMTTVRNYFKFNWVHLSGVPFRKSDVPVSSRQGLPRPVYLVGLRGQEQTERRCGDRGLWRV